MRRWSNKQKPIVNLTAMPNRFILVVGAVGSGKTAASIAGFIVHSLKYTGKVFAMIAKTSMQTDTVVKREVRVVAEELGMGIVMTKPSNG